MDRIDLALAFGMLCLMLGTLPSAVGGDAPAASRWTAGGVGTAGMASARAWDSSADGGGSDYRDEYSRGVSVPGISKKCGVVTG